MRNNSILETCLKQIPLIEGDVFHALKKTDNGFKGFGEIYFSRIKYKKIKAWKMHKKITSNLIVPFGNVEFALLDEDGQFKSFLIGEDNYKRLTIPPGIWYGFKGLGKDFSIIASIIDLVHDPFEMEKKDISSFKYDWKT